MKFSNKIHHSHFLTEEKKKIIFSVLSYFPKWIILIKRGRGYHEFQFHKCHKQLLKLKLWQWTSMSQRGGGGGNSAEKQWHCITVGIYACYPHPRWGQQLLPGKPTSAGESQQSMTVFAGSHHTACQSHASRKRRSVSHLLGGEHTCNCVKNKAQLLTVRKLRRCDSSCTHQHYQPHYTHFAQPTYEGSGGGEGGGSLSPASSAVIDFAYPS